MSLASKVKKYVEEQYSKPNFDNFTTALREIGISYFIFNSMTNDLSFFTRDQFVCSSFRYDIAEGQKMNWPALGDFLDTKALQEAIEHIDSQQISPVEFHRRTHAAGVISVTVFLEARKIYYFGLDAKFFLEEF